MHANGIFFVPKYSSKYGKKQQTEKQWPVPEMGWQPGAVNSNFALQSSALILIGSFVRIIKVDSNATSCIHFGGIDAKDECLQPAGCRNTNQKRSDCGACFLKMWRENFFVLEREFFASRTKTKIFSPYVFRSVQ
ncbi:hypothetical protein HMPREF1989_01998 [Porphyromonas gingivalis F0566]|nr:hypothetical protein HMPREF1989_01998 [Porphyromonas gingivalis F0566]